MNFGKLIFMLLAVSSFITIMSGCASVKIIPPSPPRISKQSIPKNISLTVKKAIERLYSKDPLERGEAAYALGEMRQEAVSAIPFLMGILHDYTNLEWRDPFSSAGEGERTSPGQEAAKAMVKIGEPGIKALTTVLKDNKRDYFSRQAASMALYDVKDKQAVEALKEYQNNFLSGSVQDGKKNLPPKIETKSSQE